MSLANGMKYLTLTYKAKPLLANCPLRAGIFFTGTRRSGRIILSSEPWSPSPNLISIPPTNKSPWFTMKKHLCQFLCLSLFFIYTSNAWSADDFAVACYYFPNYHTGDTRNTAKFGPEWSEWKLVQEAKPRFEGHHQPNVPAWGYTNESDPKEMAQKIDAAADHGIDAFIFDWYWFNDGPFLEKGLDEGFLKAKNNDRIKFSLMWANHDWLDIHPYTKGKRREVLYPGKVTTETFNTVCDHCIEKYFKHPSYWKIDGKPYFFVLRTFQAARKLRLG